MKILKKILRSFLKNLFIMIYLNFFNLKKYMRTSIIQNRILRKFKKYILKNQKILNFQKQKIKQ